jgi:predicted nucleotide-binding protein
MPPASGAPELTQGAEASPIGDVESAREDAIDVPAAAARDTSPAAPASERAAEPAEAVSPQAPGPIGPAAVPEPIAPAPMTEPIRREERPFAEPAPERLAEPEPTRPVGAELTPAQAIGAQLAPQDAPGAPAEREEPGAPASAPARTSQVLVAHGRDERWAQAVEHLLDQTGEHEVRVISRRAERGRIVEALGEEAPARYAIVLLTADDVGGPRLESDDEPYFSTRAHQEVVFEMGFLVAALSPGRVCVLYEDGVELPYELDQISHVRLDLAGTWQPKLLLHLRRAGFDYDMNKLAA